MVYKVTWDDGQFGYVDAGSTAEAVQKGAAYGRGTPSRVEPVAEAPKPKLPGLPEFWITIFDEHGNRIGNTKVEAINQNAAIAIGIDKVRKMGAWVTHTSTPTPRHVYLTAAQRIAPRPPRKHNPPGFVVELRDSSGNRMGGKRVPAKSVAEARKQGKKMLAERGMTIRFAGSEYVDRDGDTILPAIVLPKEAPDVPRDPYRFW
jgi:hypothetical protein